MTLQSSPENLPPGPPLPIKTCSDTPTRVTAEGASLQAFGALEIEDQSLRPSLAPLEAWDPGPTLQAWKARRVASYIDEHLGGDIRLVEVSRVAGLSASYFSKVFARTFGQSLRDYIQHQRIERAKSLMLETRQPLSVISFECGFADQAHMTRTFTRLVGEPPARWRQAREARRVASYIDEQLDGDIRLTEVSRVAGLSASYVGKVFARTFGQSLRDYIQRQRIARAKSLMLETRRALSEISLECGFGDQAHMTRTFTRLVGEPPARWRRRRQAQLQ